MKLRAYVLLCAVFLAGCDGHLRMLKLVSPSSGTPPWSVAATTIRVEGTEDVPAIVERVAHELNLTPDPSGAKRWSIRTTYQNSFTLSLYKETKGYWTIALSDWPTIGRSKQSEMAEEKIRAALKMPNKAPEPTTGTVTPRAPSSTSRASPGRGSS